MRGCRPLRGQRDIQSGGRKMGMGGKNSSEMRMGGSPASRRRRVLGQAASVFTLARDALNKQDTRERRAPGCGVSRLVLECQSSMALRDHLPDPTPFLCPIVQMRKQT